MGSQASRICSPDRSSDAVLSTAGPPIASPPTAPRPPSGTAVRRKQRFRRAHLLTVNGSGGWRSAATTKSLRPFSTVRTSAANTVSTTSSNRTTSDHHATPPCPGLLPVAREIQRDLYAYDFGLPVGEDLFGRLMTQVASRSRRKLLGQEWTPG